MQGPVRHFTQNHKCIFAGGCPCPVETAKKWLYFLKKLNVAGWQYIYTWVKKLQLGKFP